MLCHPGEGRIVAHAEQSCTLRCFWGTETQCPAMVGNPLSSFVCELFFDLSPLGTAAVLADKVPSAAQGLRDELAYVLPNAEEWDGVPKVSPV